MPFGSLWLVVILSAVVVFALSFVIHMVLKYHRADYKPLPNEDAARAALGGGSLVPGIYVTPHCPDMKLMGDPAMQAKYQKGPIAIVTILPNGLPAMPKYLGLWFGFCVLASFVTAYIARHTLHYGEDGGKVMQITGAVAFACYALGHISDSIWKGQPWTNTARHMLDALIYALGTSLMFRLMWPDTP
ncbi:MAG TPA: hypothetical protein VJW75_04690 [Candidatus Eisenbacteria bacterium]|nr:hypothetical protein [Candidatus Eisenbacteria bacterium]